MVNVRGAGFVGGRTVTIAGKAGRESGAVAVPTFYLPERRRYYAIDGNARSYTCTRARIKSLLEETSAGDGGRSVGQDLCTLGSMHAPSATCATWAFSNSRPVCC